jgi:hypothetical protein
MSIVYNSIYYYICDRDRTILIDLIEMKMFKYVNRFI